jgi:hypothetical protein
MSGNGIFFVTEMQHFAQEKKTTKTHTYTKDLCTYTHTHIQKRLTYRHKRVSLAHIHTCTYVLYTEGKVGGAKGGRRVCVPAKDGTGITIIETSRRKGNMVLCILSVAALCHDVLLLHVVTIAASASASCSC